ncbi:ABC transporter ATP-binding protein, partial [Treponema sp. OttesenSCG-928-L16]|nr:ABC transporter ATP-binding protein [Treponema sp. OttesenSCG-928-L16]
ITSLPAWKRNIAVVFQDLALFPHLDVEANVSYSPFIRRVPKAERRKIAAEQLEAVRLEAYGKRRIHTLSGGEQQRTAIARALAAQPRALLLDEPFSSLDAPLRRELRRQFLTLREKSPIPCVFVTHDREEAAVLGGRIALMSEGKIIESGNSRDMFLAPKTAFAADFFGSGMVLPCAAAGSRGPLRAVSSPFGDLVLHTSPEFDPENALVFIPRDALTPLGGGGEEKSDKAAGGSGENIEFGARFLRAVFEGERMVWECEGPGGFRFGCETNIRRPVPDAGEAVRFSLDQSLLRFIRP